MFLLGCQETKEFKFSERFKREQKAQIEREAKEKLRKERHEYLSENLIIDLVSDTCVVIIWKEMEIDTIQMTEGWKMYPDGVFYVFEKARYLYNPFSYENYIEKTRRIK